MSKILECGRQIALKGVLLQTYSLNKTVLKLILQWYSFLRKEHAKTMQTASPIGGFAVAVTRGEDATTTGGFVGVASPIGDFSMQGD